jgi:hypothetical protein
MSGSGGVDASATGGAMSSAGAASTKTSSVMAPDNSEKMT